MDCLHFEAMLFSVALLIRPKYVTLHIPGVGAQVDFMQDRVKDDKSWWESWGEWMWNLAGEERKQTWKMTS